LFKTGEIAVLVSLSPFTPDSNISAHWFDFSAGSNTSTGYLLGHYQLLTPCQIERC
jgi:hypothetical protein